jgi:tetraacyldisaccharide 4'-kinase
LKPPAFWQDRRSVAAALLAPLGCLYGLGGRLRRALAHPADLNAPVICVGNLTAGGTGKTPVVLALAAMLRDAGRHPHIVTRGYGGSLPGPVRVDPSRHDSRAVGDEALLLVRAAPCWVARDRAAGGRAALADGADTIILDDGFQNPALVQDIALVVIDGETGFGNERLIPAGPLREPIARGLARADAIIIMGADRVGVGRLLDRLAPDLARLDAHLVPTDAAASLKGTRVWGFAGIGRPEKFCATLGDIGCAVAGFTAFADHHPFSADDLARLRRDAARAGARLVTTAKDHARLSGELTAEDIAVVEINAVFDDPAALGRLIGLGAS